MSQTFIREVRCDCCGKVIEDLFTGYVTKQLGTNHQLLYDLCMKCNYETSQLMALYEDKMIKEFENKEGRLMGEGEEYMRWEE